MSDQIIGLHDWFQTPAGLHLLEWERAQLNAVVADVFGYHALQLGLPEIYALQTNRMPHQWLAVSDERAMQVADSSYKPALMTEFSALPFAANSLDLVVLPHSLEFSRDPHGTLREVERVLVPEGRVVICGLNPASLWGWRQQRERFYQRLGFGQLYLPDAGDFIGYWRLRDWLRLLNFEVESGSFGCYRPALRSQTWLQRFAWMDKLGAHSWPILGAAYCVVAVKRVRGMRMLEPSWKRPRFAKSSAPVSIAPRAHFHWPADELSKNKHEHD
jgi:SAM-dependent methyltransferase